MKTTEQINTLLDLNLDDMIRECAALGIDTIEHSETIQEMYEDGFDSYEVKEMVEVIQDRDHYSYIPSL
jgi:sugar phosphate isomerase/epimerase